MKVSRKLLRTRNIPCPPNPDSGHWKGEDYNFALIFTLQVNKSYRYTLYKWFQTNIELKSEDEL
jgi:hypothetical protein